MADTLITPSSTIVNVFITGRAFGNNKGLLNGASKIEIWLLS